MLVGLSSFPQSAFRRRLSRVRIAPRPGRSHIRVSPTSSVRSYWFFQFSFPPSENIPDITRIPSSLNSQQRNPHRSYCVLLQCVAFGGEVQHSREIGDNSRSRKLKPRETARAGAESVPNSDIGWVRSGVIQRRVNRGGIDFQDGYAKYIWSYP
jgi:hypothetical protein